MGVPVQSFLKRRRDRAVGSILGYVEREIFSDLSTAQQQSLRRVVLDALNGYHDSVLDLVKAEDGVRNDVVLEALDRLDRHVRTRVDSRPQPADDQGVSESHARAEVGVAP